MSNFNPLQSYSSSNGSIPVESFGAVGDGTTDDSAAINAAIQSAYTQGKVLTLAAKTYYCASKVLFNVPIKMQGIDRAQTVLKFRNGVDGLYVAYQGGPIGGGASNGTITDLRIISSSSVGIWTASAGCVAGVTCFKPTAGYSGFIYECTTSGTSGTIEPVWPTTDGATVNANGGSAVFTARYVCGIKCLANSVQFARITVSAWPGDGIGIPADTGAGNNGNLCMFFDCRSDSALGYGAQPNGPDANMCLFEKCDFNSNGLGGVFDRSALGCVFSACHFAANTNPAFDMYDVAHTASSAAHLDGCYLEGGQTARLYAYGMWNGGIGAQNVDTTLGGLVDAGPGRNTVYTTQVVSGVTYARRIMRTGSAVIDEFGTSDDSNKLFQLGYKQVNNVGGQTGWWAWLYQNVSPWAMSNSLAAEGSGQLWLPNGFYVGAPDYKAKYAWLDAAPTSGAHVAGEVVFDRATLEGRWCWICTAAGTPGTWKTIYYPNIPTALTTAGTAITVDWAVAQTPVVSLAGASGNVTLTLNNAEAGQWYTIKVIQGNPARNIVWPAAVKWPGGTAPTISVANGAIDLIEMFYDGTIYMASFKQAFA